MYDKLAPVYDHFVNWKSRLAFEMPLILELLSKLGTEPHETKVIDTACGTGQHAITLAEAGYLSYGADISPEMVSIGKIRADASDQLVVFKTKGFGATSQAFSKDLPFDATLCLGNSLPHVSDELALKVALQDFHNLLRPGGLLLLQMRNFDRVMRHHLRWLDPQSEKTDHHEWLFLRFYDFESEKRIQFNVISMERHKDQPWSIDMASTPLIPILKDRLVDLLLETGFDSIQTLGSLNGEPFDPETSSDLIVVAYKASEVA
jgi:glycine/sarcosine N-methyltransferase